MFIAIIGTRCSGKSTVMEFLVQQKKFQPIYLASSLDAPRRPPKPPRNPLASYHDSKNHTERPVSFLVMNSPISPFFTPMESPPLHNPDLIFQKSSDMLDFVTRNWLEDFVTMDLNTTEVLQTFRVRPFFLVLNIDAPIMNRFQRSARSSDRRSSLEDFVREHDECMYGVPKSLTASSQSLLVQDVKKLAHIHVINDFPTIPELHSHLDQLNILNQEILRPGWDTYFMLLADLASQRSNCMKRRVGAILVRDNRILSTGYNGTPRGLINCNEGGCTRCNTASETPDECVCLHAEENALLEAGRERVGDGAVLYCNTCPCLKCTIKIIQTGVREVVYSLSYKVDDASAAMFKEAGVGLRRHAPPS
ncbi:cytidine deaminase-like protein [Cristinia sonorae]|uniref:Deoxycytidylate deaminase n=1 Tax=Cristinia sonorae TaxID=1940300 RepID=A0A8K0URP2_9AGAR|nr:cytidine deaminase-like protein [Cristinia sonorae]